MSYYAKSLSQSWGLLCRFCVQWSWIFTFTIFGNLREGYPFSTKWLPRDHHVVVLRPEFCIPRLRYTVKNKKCKEEVQRMLSFLFVEEGKLFIKKSSFEELKLVFFTAERAVCFEMQPRRRSFCWIFRYILHPVAKKISFLKRNLCIYKRFIYVSYIFSSALKKNYKMRPAFRWILCWILPCAQPILVAWTDPRSR